jgi:hypothetical protein
MAGTILYKKAAAAVLLTVLLLTSIVQLTHSHTAKPGIAVQLKKTTTVNEVFAAQNNDANCFICNYKLAKDADNFFPPSIIIITSSFAILNDNYIIHEHSQIFSQFETRGPPSSFSAI